jgi:hypothetical protein
VGNGGGLADERARQWADEIDEGAESTLAYLQAMVALESAGLPGLNYAPRNETTAGIENRARTYGAGLARSCTALSHALGDACLPASCRYC